MLGVNNLASYGFFGGGTVGNVLAQWEAMGVFSHLLPFLLLFALVFGLLMRIKIFTQGSDGKEPNKAINAIIALSVALMSLQFNFVSLFFAELFPRVGIALSIILVILVVGGLFLPSNSKGFSWGLIATVFVIIAVVLYQSLEAFGYTGIGALFRYNLGNIFGVVIFLGLVIAVVAGATPTSQEKPDTILSRLIEN